VERRGRGGLTVTWGAGAPVHRRYLLCTTPALGHTAPLLALSRRLVEQGDEVAFYTTPHYEERVEATGAQFLPFEAAFDAHDLMVVNPEREASAKRGVSGVKDDLRRIFVGPVPGQARDIDTILEAYSADCVVVDSMFLGAIPLALRPRASRPAVACVGVMPYSQPSRDTAPFGIGMQPGRGPLARLRNRTLNWLTVHGALADIQRFTRTRLAEAGAPGVKAYLLDLQPTLTDAYFQATVSGFEYPRSDQASTVRFVGPILGPPSSASSSSSSSSADSSELPSWWPELSAERPVVHVTQGTLDNADLGRLLLLTIEALSDDDVLVVATTGGPDPEPLRPALPDNARLERFLPHDVLLPRVDVMVTNGGYGGVQQALAHGVPLVVAGDSEDKPEVAARVQWSGTGINLHTGRPSKAMVSRAVRRVLTRPSYRARARALQEEIAACDPLGDITARLAELCATASPKP
jgi:UDP:flavonoid glycosyltransferase YjiC (YdhE family)